MDDPDVLKLQKMLTDITKNKPPIGKQLIMDIAKAGMAATKHFKHVVHLIEKFILKSKSIYKLYGFYIIDAIVRQAQKKFKHKDVWAGRFALNLRQTLVNALSCPTKDKPKIVRVLNLWRANGIFGDEVLRPLIQHCRASGMDVDVEIVEKAVKGEKADMSRYGSSSAYNDSDVKAPTTAPVPSSSSRSSAPSHDTFILNLLSSLNPEYNRLFSTNHGALRKVQDLITEKVKNGAGSNKIQNILSAEFDYSDDDSTDENKTDMSALPREQVNKATEALFKMPSIVNEIRNIYLQNGGNDSHGTSNRYDDRDRKRRRSRSLSRDRKDSDKRRDRKRSRDRSYRHRSSTPRQHRDEKRDKERKKLGFPQEPKREHFIIGSRTIWLGRLPPNCSESEIKQALSDYGTPERIQIINSRACAYVELLDRRTAFKIMDKMRDKLEVSRKPVKVSWATGQGLKDDNKLAVFWDNSHGYHEIPWTFLPSKIEHLFEGSYADLDTLPPKFKGVFDEKGKLLKPKSPSLPPPAEHASSTNLSHVPLPPPEQPLLQHQPLNTVPTGVPPPLSTFQPGILPHGLSLPPALDGKDAAASLELLMAVANSNQTQPGILGARPPFNPALLNTLHALNVRPPLSNVNQATFPRHEGPLPDQQAAFQQFRSTAPSLFRNEITNRGGFQNRSFSPRMNNGNRFPLPDMSQPPPSMGFSAPPPRLPISNFSHPPPNLNNIAAEHHDEPMDIAGESPEAPPGV